MIVCPCCKESYPIDEIRVTRPERKENPRWFEPSHRAGKITCPRCGCVLRLKKSSLWPFVFFLVPMLDWPFVPHDYWIWHLIVISLLAILLARRTARYRRASR